MHLRKCHCLWHYLVSLFMVATVHASWEADVSPRPDGDDDLLVNDWVQVGRFVAGLDIADLGVEFQRTDCAPYDGGGDDYLLVNDWVQAGRYVAGLDAPQVQGGPTGEVEIVPGVTLPIGVGWFKMGRPYTDAGYNNEIPVHDVYLDSYKIGKYPVTNQEYADVLNWAYRQGYLTNASGGMYTGGLIYAYGQPIADTQGSDNESQITYSGGVFRTCSQTGHGDQSFSMADHPMVKVSWFGSVCYCNWLSEQQGLQPVYDITTWERYEPVRNGYRLPTEAEWERAAAWDGSKHWRYGMTSDTLDKNNSNNFWDGVSINPLGLTSFPYTTPVGWYNGVNPVRLGEPDTLTVNATSPAGAYDMTGNVWEWVHDWSYRPYLTGSASNPTGPSTGTERMVRGGSWGDYLFSFLRTAHRLARHSPDVRLSIIGFRISQTS